MVSHKEKKKDTNVSILKKKKLKKKIERRNPKSDGGEKKERLKIC